MDDLVIIKCYNKVETKKRGEAIAFYYEALSGCDQSSSEADRYCSIIAGLEAGRAEVDDLWKWNKF